MRLLHFRISLSQHESRFAQAETELAEDTLALAYAHRDLILLLNPSAQGLAIPDIAAQPRLPRRLAQDSIHGFHLFFTEPWRAPRPFSFQQSCQTTFFKATDPILHRSGCITQPARHLRAGHALGNQKHSMKAVIIARFFRTTDFVLKPQYDRGRIGNLAWFHSFMKPGLFNMRNYLCRYV
jgi:hypothetical protein